MRVKEISVCGRGGSILPATLWLLCAFALIAAKPQTALAAWPLANASRVTVPFGALYAADGRSLQHRGVDLEAAAGASVRAPFKGTVSFVGRIPVVGGGSVLAVTLLTPAGRVTLLPFEHSAVAEGAAVAETTVLGVLAADGDGSSAGPHLHVGLRDGDLYLDPLSVLAPPAVAGDDGAGQNSAAGEGVGAAAGAGVGVGVTAGGATGAAPGRAVGMPAGVSLAPSGATADRTTFAGELAPGVSLAGAGAAIAAAAPKGTRASGGTREPAGHTAGEPVRPVGTQPIADAHAERRARTLETVSAGLSALAARSRAAAAGAVRLGGYALLGLLAGIATLWPLWRGARKGLGKVQVRAVADDVAAAQTR